MIHKSLQFMQDCLEQANVLDQQKISYREEESVYLEKMEKLVLNYRKQSHEELVSLLHTKQIHSEDRVLVWEFVNLLRRYYFNNATFQTISKPYQELCSFLISLSLQGNDKTGSNFLKYFDPHSAYYLRIKALNAFRLLKDPVYEIEKKLPEVADLLRKALEREPAEMHLALEILKEYIEKVFGLTRKTLDARAQFVAMAESESWKNRCATSEFGAWLVKFLEEEKAEDLRDLREPTSEDFLESDRSQYTQVLEEYVQQQNQLISSLQQQLEMLQKQQAISEEFSIAISEQEGEKSGLSADVSREFYRIMIVGGADKANKAYKNLQKEKPDFLQEFGLDWKQLELEGDYNLQKDEHFAKKVKDALLLEKVNFVIALQTDHESPFVNLLKDPEIAHKITIFAEREIGGSMPKFSGQKFSQERFRYYLNKALQKFERENRNTQNACW